MFQFFRDRSAYSRLRKDLIRRARLSCQQLNLPEDDVLVAAFGKAKTPATGGAFVGGRRTADRTPVELEPLMEIMFSYPPELSAWLILYRIQKAIFTLGLPIQLQGDIMMAIESANFVLPAKTVEAACVLAHALCMMPSLGRARATLLNLGVPYNDEVSEDDARLLVRQGYLPSDLKVSTGGPVRLGWNVEMREAVVQELARISPEAPRLLQVSRMQQSEEKALKRWDKMPASDAVELLQKGMDLAGSGRLDEALDVLDRAALADPLVRPDVFRNKAWVFARRKQYDRAVECCRQALQIDPDYAEVWYHLGICLAQLKRFGEGLSAFEKAKSLGFRSGGLELNMNTCRRAISDGLR
jgi:tetratricopeptide (TPR) repeat protein